MSTSVAIRETQEADLIEKLVVEGDLAKLSSSERVRYYYAMCQRAGLDPLSQPLEYLKLQGKLVLYFKRVATDQIASNHKLSRRIVRAEMVGDVYLVVAECSDAAGRVEQSTGAVSTDHLGGDNLVNAMLKAESKAKRRAVLSFTGLGMLDESEAESIPGAARIDLRQLHGDPMPPRLGEAMITDEQFDQIANYSRILREQFTVESPGQKAVRRYTAAQADTEIARLATELVRLEAERTAEAAFPTVAAPAPRGYNAEAGLFEDETESPL